MKKLMILLLALVCALLTINLPRLLQLCGSAVTQIDQEASPEWYGDILRREIDLNVTPTASEAEISPLAASERIPIVQNEEVQSNRREDYHRDLQSLSPPIKKPVKKQYECRKLSLKRFQFKFSRKGQELAKELPFADKVKYDKDLERLRQKRREYRQKSIRKMRILVEQNDPIGLRRSQHFGEISRRASRRHYQKKRAKNAKQDNTLPDNAPQPRSLMKRAEMQGSENDVQLDAQNLAQQPSATVEKNLVVSDKH